MSTLRHQAVFRFFAKNLRLNALIFLNFKSMKSQAIIYTVLSSLILITVTVFAVMNIPFNWLFYLIVFGQVFFVFSVYKVLTEDYHTDKTFEDFYEDHPIGREEFE